MEQTQAIVIPATELPGLEASLARADQYDAQLAPLKVKAQAALITDAQTYAETGAVLTEVRSIRKQVEAEFSPFDAIVSRVKDFLKTQKQRHTNLCEQIESICLPKMKDYEHKEREAAQKEQEALNKKNKTEGLAVKPDLPAVAGYRKSVTYPIEVVDLAEFMKDYARAVVRKDKDRVQFLRKFIMLDEKALASHARDLKDPDAFMKEVPGVKCTRQ